MPTEKDKALELAIDQIEKQFGQGAIMRFNDSSAQVKIGVIPTGSRHRNFRT
jgi:recombination protein RecA